MPPISTFNIGKKRVGIGNPVYVIAEAGSNHNRDLNLARKLVDVAAEAGADAIKFQLFHAEHLYPPNCGVVPTPMGEADFFDVIRKNEIPDSWLEELKSYSEKQGIAFLCSPFDENAVLRLNSLGVSAFKIASPELNHLPLLEEAARFGKPLLCSTGISTMADIEEALSTIRGINPQAPIGLLHCISSYPCPMDQLNIKIIETLTNAFGLPIGFSDHSLDYQCVPQMATAVGACFIEKHFTLNRATAGPDHPFSLEPNELKEMVAAIRSIEKIKPDDRLNSLKETYGKTQVQVILGHGRKEIAPAEADLYPCDKRSIHAVQAIPEGGVLTPQNIRILRSERNLKPGLHPRFWKVILNCKTTHSIKSGEGISWEHLLASKN